MGPAIRSASTLEISGNGACTGAIFPGEDTAVLFLVHSGDILEARAAAWHEVTESGILGTTPIAHNYPFSEDAVALLAHLEHLGIELA